MSSNQTLPGFLKGKVELPDIKAHLFFWPLIAIGLTLDLCTKAAVFDWLEQKPDNRFPIANGFLQLVLAQNDGAAFGLFSGYPHWLIIFSAAAFIAIVAFFLFGGIKQRLVHVALGCFGAGICGNFYDRVFNDGHVRDFIDVYYRQYHWPAFNIADSLLCIGIGVLILSALLTDKPHQTHAQQHK